MIMMFMDASGPSHMFIWAVRVEHSPTQQFEFRSAAPGTTPTLIELKPDFSAMRAIEGTEVVLGGNSAIQVSTYGFFPIGITHFCTVARDTAAVD
ncbi:MAG: hypothetical protein RR736_07725 [Pseudomonas sp.]|uniref:hypothetical protein n=1 Tax=Pseudomonas sp. TaxID=306 RepID=UPI002FCAA99B